MLSINHNDPLHFGFRQPRKDQEDLRHDEIARHLERIRNVHYDPQHLPRPNGEPKELSN